MMPTAAEFGHRLQMRKGRSFLCEKSGLLVGTLFWQEVPPGIEPGDDRFAGRRLRRVITNPLTAARKVAAVDRKRESAKYRAELLYGLLCEKLHHETGKEN